MSNSNKSYLLTQILSSYAVNAAKKGKDHATLARLATLNKTTSNHMGARSTLKSVAENVIAKSGEFNYDSTVRALRHMWPKLIEFVLFCESSVAQHLQVTKQIAISFMLILTSSLCEHYAADLKKIAVWISRIKATTWTELYQTNKNEGYKKFIVSMMNLERDLSKTKDPRLKRLLVAVQIDSIKKAAAHMINLTEDQLQQHSDKYHKEATASFCYVVEYDDDIRSKLLESRNSLPRNTKTSKQLMNIEDAIDVLQANTDIKRTKDAYVNSLKDFDETYDSTQSELSKILKLNSADIAMKKHSIQLASLFVIISTQSLITNFQNRHQDLWTTLTGLKILQPKDWNFFDRVLFPPDKFHAKSPLWAKFGEHVVRLQAETANFKPSQKTAVYNSIKHIISKLADVYEKHNVKQIEYFQKLKSYQDKKK